AKLLEWGWASQVIAGITECPRLRRPLRPQSYRPQQARPADAPCTLDSQDPRRDLAEDPGPNHALPEDVSQTFPEKNRRTLSATIRLWKAGIPGNAQPTIVGHGCQRPGENPSR